VFAAAAPPYPDVAGQPDVPPAGQPDSGAAELSAKAWTAWVPAFPQRAAPTHAPTEGERMALVSPFVGFQAVAAGAVPKVSDRAAALPVPGAQ